MVRVLDQRGSAAQLHAIEMPTGSRPEVWVMHPTGPALVRGSAQRDDAFDTGALAAAGIELAPRRSGGGAVWIDPATTVWVDALVPRGSALWSDDLAETFRLVGRVWQRALSQLGVETEIVDDAPSRDALSRWVCWAGRGWGELVLPGARGNAVDKVVGFSQRRTRWGARVQGMAVLDASAGKAVDWFVGPDAPSRHELSARVGLADHRIDVGIAEVATVVAQGLQAAFVDPLMPPAV